MEQQLERARAALKSVFGYDSFRPLQGDIISHILEKKDALVVMPTGGGKSICYQIPALLFNGLTVVVSPLISLMKDQVDQLRECGAPAAFLNSSLNYSQYSSVIDNLKKGRIKILYLAPEALMAERTLAVLSSCEISCLAIDEAHCISEWGHDFRPEYRQLLEVRSRFPDAVCAAFTATATARVREDIRKSLCIDAEFIGSFDRPNLFLEAVPKESPRNQLVEFISRFPGESGIVYCFSRQQTGQISSFLEEKGFSVRPYHAGLAEEERTRNQDLFVRDDVQIIVATIAFGMGINKSDVRFVVHFDLPKSLESYYQEIGRAGRDGQPAHCLLLFGYGDVRKVRHFVDQKAEHEKMVANILLSSLIGYLETDQCRRVPLLRYFGEEYAPENCGMCDNCRGKQKELTDITVPAQMFLSCVKRTGENFGAGQVIDILRGSQSQKVLKFGHEKLSTHGIGKMYSVRQWRHLFRQLVQKGAIAQEYEHGTLKLTDKAWSVLKGRETFFGLLDERPEKITAEHKDSGPYDADLFELLRKKRKELADRADLPPFTIFHNRTLKEMAASLPVTREQLSAVYGIGERKMEKYGDIFLDIIVRFRRDRQSGKPHCGETQ
jgi:ATP-dependent DNA helicase RecQ